jgi:dipeptidyl-peptidase 4
MRHLPCLVAFLALPVLAGQQPMPFERIFAEPPADGLIPRQIRWLPDGRHFSYLECTTSRDDSCGTLVVEDASKSGREVVLTVADLKSVGAGEAAVKPGLAGYVWTPQGDAVLLSGDGELFLVARAKNKAVRRLTTSKEAEESATFSPDGKMLAYARSGDVFVLDLASGREHRVAGEGTTDKLNGTFDWVYQEEVVGDDTAPLVWSPDSRKLALITLDERDVLTVPITDPLPTHPTTTLQRYPAAGDVNPLVGLTLLDVLPNASGASRRKEIAWIGQKSLYLARFGWTSDSRQAWFETLDRGQENLELFRESLDDEPEERELLDHDSAWVNATDDLRILGPRQMLWTSELDGSRHIYVGMPGRPTMQQLTKGAWEVTRVECVDETAGAVYFTATEKSRVERHLYRVGIDGKGLRRLTQDDGTHEVIASPSCRFFLDTYSSLDRPRSVRLLDREGKVVRVVAANDHPPLLDFSRATTELVTVPGPAGGQLHAMLTRPADLESGRKYPVVVYVYGGPHEQLVRNRWGGRNAMFHSYLASQGILVFTLDNRGSAGRGRAFERALLGRLGKVELEDQLAGVAWLKAQPFVDPERIGIWGWSYGGFMTTYAMSNAPGVFKAGAAVAPVTDWRYYDTVYTERYLKQPAANPDGYRDSSPVNQAEHLTGALLLVHGSGDDNVHWQNTLAFVDKLYKAGKPYDLQIYPNKTHSIAGPEARTHLYRRIADHFLRYLGRASAVPAGGEVRPPSP